MSRKFFVLVSLIAIAAAITSVAIPVEGAEQFHPRRVIIKFTDDATPSQRQAVMSDLGATQQTSLWLINAEVWEITNYTPDVAARQYRMYENVEYIEPDYVVNAIEVPNDPMFNQLWGLHNTGQTGGTADADIDAVEAWDIFTGSSDALVVVIDTGTDYNHADLAANMWVNPNEIPGNGIDDDGNGFVDDVRGWDFYNNDNDPMDDNGHGTHCAGTIGAVGNNGTGVVGVNWTVKIMPVKFLSSGGSGYTSGAVQSIQYALTIPGVKVMSNSWGGGGYSQALYDAIVEAYNAGVLFVCAAGNSAVNTDTSPMYPACYDVPNVMSIAATDHNDQLASFSNWGPTTVDLGAPGVDVVSTLPGNSYGSLSGTSMATPHVSGVAALIWGRFPSMTVDQVKALIMNSVDPIPSLAGKCVTGGRLNAFWCIAEPDSIPPAAVTDLTAFNPASNTIDLTWTATGDDGYEGRASRYDVRYSTEPIDEDNFYSANIAMGAPDPGPAGATETMTVSGLDFNTTYYFALKVFDEYGNPSPISNLASETTLGIPDIAVDPTSMTEELISGGTSVQTLTVYNVGEGTLDFVAPEPILIMGSSVQGEYLDVPKGEPDPRTGEPVTEGRGGPDGFGYRWIDSDELGGPVFDWVDITSVGTQIPMTGDDVNTGPYPIGFDFEFYGNTFDSFRVCTNGFLSFTSTSTAYSNQPIPNTGAPENLIAPFWDDLNFGTDERCYYYNDGTRLIVQWHEVPHYSVGGPYTFQAILYPNGNMVFQYLSMGEPTNSATVGIQNDTKTDGLQIAFNANYIHDNLAIKISALPQWVTVTPSSGRVWAGGSMDLSVNFNATGLLGGYYDANILLVSNDPDESNTIVPVQLHVIGAPDIAVSPTSLDFGEVFIGAIRNLTIIVSNPGTDQLEITDITSSSPNFDANPKVFSLAPRAAQAVTVSFAPTDPGPTSGMLTVYSNDPDEPEVYVDLAGIGLIPPSFSVTPESLFADLMTGQAQAQTLTITNSGGSDFIFTASVELYGMTANVEQGDPYEYPKSEEELDPRTSGPQTMGSGGPDNFGYTWIDSDEPGGPVFDWFDITTVGTRIPGLNGDDQNRGPIPIGFDFPFYGNTFSTIRACTNGWLSFTSTLTSLSNLMLPNMSAPENLLAVFWDDLHFRSVERAYYYYDGTRFIVQYDHVPRYSTTPPSDLTFQVILYPNGTIIYQYLTMTGVLNSATIGIQNQTKNDGLTVVYNADYVHDNLAIKFATAPEWLSVSPTSGVIPPGRSMNLTALFNATDLIGGDYFGAVHIDGNDPLVPRWTVPAHLHVTGAPDIATDPSEVDFGSVFLGYSTLRQLRVINLGTDVLTVSDIVPGSAEYGVDITSFTLNPYQQILLTVSFAPAEVGDRSSVLTIYSDDPDEPEVVIPLTGYGLIAPDIAVSPESFSEDLFVGETATHQLHIENTGGSDLNFTIGVRLSAEQVEQYDYLELGKEEEDPRPGILGSGGPDMFGYTWIDSDEPGGPIYDWVDISTIGTPIFGAYNDDANRGPFPIGFTFPFYGNNFTEFRVCTNGWLSFTSTLTTYANQPLPNAGAPENLLAVFWDDMVVDPSYGGEVYYYSDGTKLIVQYEVRYIGQSAPPFYSFEVILYPNGKILYQYRTLGATRNSATIGIQNATKDDGLTVVYNADYAHDNLAIELSFVPDWLTVTPASGTIPAGEYLDLDVVFDATGLYGGDYNGSINITSNDPDEGLVIVPAFLHVTGAPDIYVDPLALDFGWIYLTQTKTLTVRVTNIGTDLLEITSLTLDSDQFSTDLTPFNLNPRQSRILQVVFAPTVPGVSAGMLTLYTNDLDEPEVQISLVGEGVVPPECEIDPDTIRVAALQGMVKTKILRVMNTGGSDLIWDASKIQLTGQVEQYDYLELGKEEEDPRPGILGSGGPDMFGYTWIDSDEPGGPIYDWVDISTIGTPIFGAYNDDANRGPFPIGFTFPFYGNNFTEFRVCTNGWLSFTSTLTTYANQPLPNAGAPENLLAVFWDDMVVDPSYGGEVYYYSDGTKLIVQYEVRYIGQSAPPFYSFEVILYPNGKILYQYRTLGATRNSATIGIQNATKDDGLTVVFNADYAHEDLAILFSAGPEWLTISPVSGVIPAGGYEDITVTCDATELEDGLYEGLITIASNDLTDPIVNCPVYFNVGYIAPRYADFSPNTLNLKSNRRWVDVKIGIPAGYDPNTAVFSSMFVAHGDQMVIPPDRAHIIGPDSGGLYAVHAKFSREAVGEILPTGSSVEVVMGVELDGITYLVGSEFIKVISGKIEVALPGAGDVL
ncbi:MAG: S8 family serine peptidase, partial [bacterium]